MQSLSFLRTKLLLLLCTASVILAACGGGDSSVSTPQASAANSTITAAPSTVTADGTAAAAIAVTLLDTNGQPFTGSADVVISADPCTSCTLHYSNDNGEVTGTLTSTAAEDITLSFTVNGTASPSTATVHFVAGESSPNIVLVIMDDIGEDQWRLFGYGGYTPASTPNIDEIAHKGVKFHNLWSMPACSNGRATLFTGRYPFRVHTYNALGNNDLANYMVNPNEMTLPKLLALRGYKSALFGKFHMGIQSNNPYGVAMVHAFGFDYYNGWLDITGDPSSVDTTAGGVSPPGTWSCGFVRDAKHGGADSGACYAGDGSCQEMSKTGTEAPGRVCRDSGGIFDPNKSCADPTPGYINFDTLSGHYVSPLYTNNEDGSVEQVPLTDIQARTFRGIEPVNAALDWIGEQPAGQPWMVVLSFATDHTPLMQPPKQTLPITEPDSSNLDCSIATDQRILSNEMEESMDYEIGEFMVKAGLASYDSNGQLVYDPKASNTYVIFVSDNGSLGTVVKVPFDPTRAKSTAYQTGVWNPAIVTGPDVADPGREVDAMTNIVDLYHLIGELAGIDVDQAVPRTLDAQPLLPYLENPDQAEIRTTNYTEIGTNTHANGVLNGPCVFPGTSATGGTACTQITPSAGVCHDNGGSWWGPDPDDPSVPSEGLALCCDVAIWQHDHDEEIISTIYPKSAEAIRNDNYKLVVNKYNSYNAGANACADTTSTEFYQINEDIPTPKIDTEDANLLANGAPPLTQEQQENYDALSADLNTLRGTQQDCPADVNLDGVVNQEDVDQWQMFEQLSDGKSSWADINQDGLTNDADKTLIEQDMGACPVASGSTGKSVGKR
ncbi:MAG: sulfatase-like hydrolase/transferase [Gammaproteobacteria bacterium]